MNTIGERLAYTRSKILSLNQTEFATILGISQGALSAIEQNKRGISMEAIINLLKYAKQDNSISCEWILTGEDNPKTSLPYNLSEDEKELINTYNQLDRRGQHRIHTIIYEELDRITNQKDLSQEESAEFISSKDTYKLQENA